MTAHCPEQVSDDEVIGSEEVADQAAEPKPMPAIAKANCILADDGTAMHLLPGALKTIRLEKRPDKR